MWTRAGRVPAGKVSSPPAESIAVRGAAGEQLLELECTVGRAQHKCVALMDSGASHCFLSATVARKSGLVLDTSQCLQVRMVDGELRASQGLTHNGQVEFAPGVMQMWDL